MSARMFAPGMFAFLVAMATQGPLSCSDEDDSANSIRKAAGVVVHAVAIYGTDDYLLRNEDVKDWPKLMTLLQLTAGPSSRFRDFFPRKLQDKYSDSNHVLREIRMGESSELGIETMSAFRKLLAEREVYSETAFKDVKLDQEVKKLLAIKPEERTYLQTITLNRRLLNAAFPDCMVNVAETYHSARVKVLSGDAIVLVLSSYGCCRWKIEAAAGVKVLGIVLCGHEAQEVEGVEAPIFYRVLHTKSGGVSQLESFQFNKETDPDYLRASACVKKLIGHEIKAFQSRHRPGRKPFEISARK